MEVDVLGSSCLTSRTVSVDVTQPELNWNASDISSLVTVCVCVCVCVCVRNRRVGGGRRIQTTILTP